MQCEYVLELYGLQGVVQEDDPVRLPIYSLSHGISNPGRGWDDDEDEGEGQQRQRPSVSSLNLMCKMSRDQIRGPVLQVVSGARFSRFRMICFRTVRDREVVTDDALNQLSNRQLWRRGLLEYRPVVMCESVGKCLIESWQMSGSSGSGELMTVSMSLDSQGNAYHIQDADDEELNLSSDEDEEGPVKSGKLGASVALASRDDAPTMAEFGAAEEWSPKTHKDLRLWPRQFREAVFAFLQARHAQPYIAALPKDILFMIIRFVAWNYSQTARRFANPSPFATVTYYGRPCAYPKKPRAKVEKKKEQQQE